VHATVATFTRDTAREDSSEDDAAANTLVVRPRWRTTARDEGFPGRDAVVASAERAASACPGFNVDSACMSRWEERKGRNRCREGARVVVPGTDVELDNRLARHWLALVFR
jgi:hypothetical protein